MKLGFSTTLILLIKSDRIITALELNVYNPTSQNENLSVWKPLPTEVHPRRLRRCGATRLRAESEIKCKSWRRTATGQCQRVSWISGSDRLRNGRNGTLPLVGAGMPLACIYTACSTCTVKLMVHYRRPLCSNRATRCDGDKINSFYGQQSVCGLIRVYHLPRLT